MVDAYKHIKDAYDKGAQQYSDYWKSPHDFIEEDRSNFLKALSLNSTILDVGCGPGMDSEYFYKKGYQVIGIDLSEEMIKLASKRVPKINFKVCDMRYIDFPQESFHGIWSSFSFLHIDKVDAPLVLEGFLNLLKPGGILMLALHSPKDSAYEQRNITGLETNTGEQLGTYLQEWDKEEIVNLLSKIGFNIEYARSFTRDGGWYPLLSILAKKN